VKTEQDLKDFHKDIMRDMGTYTPPRHLFTELDETHRGYLEGQANCRYYWWLALAVRSLGPERILELGTAVGASAIMIYSEKRVVTDFTTVDIMDHGKFIPDHMTSDGTFFRTIWDANAPELYHLIGKDKVDFLFLDTDHTADQLMTQLRLCRSVLKPGALVALDDINMNDMRTAWDALPYVKLDITDDCHYSGFGVFIYDPEVQL
jgi:predicted O-methyltransferase YrrM